MLDRVKIKGFQVHEDLDVRLDPLNDIDENRDL